MTIKRNESLSEMYSAQRRGWCAVCLSEAKTIMLYDSLSVVKVKIPNYKAYYLYSITNGKPCTK